MRRLLTIAAISGFTAVLLGAMGAHFLSPLMKDGGQELFHTANLYHLIHSLALLICSLLVSTAQKSQKAMRFLWLASGSFILGMILFSGILYYSAIFSDFPFHLLIPLGGLFYMIGWLLLIGVATFLETP
ncbi:MAG: DUF423 domain-containing protein [Emcibacter sp.]|nr:DUF423 domain-containing protein [Emcibacter sp.]